MLLGTAWFHTCGASAGELSSRNLHLCADVGAGMIVTKRLMGLDFVVGKSMALRRSDLDALGGFEAVKDVLAEDWVMGRWCGAR
jgi:hypothetical protein